MSPQTKHYQVVIVGAGPVGLFLGCCLHHFGIAFVILERRRERRGQTRAIGIHPPSLELFQRLGLADRLASRGVRVQTGRAYNGDRMLGEVSFADLPLPFNYILTLPQYETESVMEEHLSQVAPGAIVRDAHVESFREVNGKLLIRCRVGGTMDQESSAFYVVGCDGPRSVVREKSAIAFEGGEYDDAFVMGDFSDHTGYQSEARIFLDDEGFIESFPLPGGVRRWVIQTPALMTNPSESDFCEQILKRTGVDLARTLSSLLSAFSVHHYLAETFVKGRAILAGDSAHVMSPIGGQGMNVGWMDALDIAGALHHVASANVSADDELSRYNDRARERAAKAIGRAEVYMAIGRSSRLSWLKRKALSVALRMPGKNIAAEYFTMRGL